MNGITELNNFCNSESIIMRNEDSPHRLPVCRRYGSSIISIIVIPVVGTIGGQGIIAVGFGDGGPIGRLRGDRCASRCLSK